MKSILKWIFGGSRVDRLLLAATVVAGANKKAPKRGAVAHNGPPSLYG